MSADGVPSRWELAAEAIALKIRWFGLLVGTAYANLNPAAGDGPWQNLLLLVGLAYTLVDTWHHRRGRVFLHGWPLTVSLMEAVFIGLLCHFDAQADSPFRYYFFLSVICCGIRHSPGVTYATCLLDLLSVLALYCAAPSPGRSAFSLLALVVVLAWVAWAASSMSRLLKHFGEHLGRLNEALRENQGQLERRIAERSLELQETQAQVLHQEKMAGFGLLAAGIAHEIGNPLTAISTLLQLLQYAHSDDTTRGKLTLIAGEVTRIQRIVRELVTFSRPTSLARSRCSVEGIVREALDIAKYYKGTKSRTLEAELAEPLPWVRGSRDQLIQVVFNLVLNAIDATAKGGRIVVSARAGEGGRVLLAVRDDGAGIPAAALGKLFQPYFTTKKQGTGLGLFVTRKIVHEHGGTVRCESAPGAGTLFEIDLPGEAAEPSFLGTPAS